MMPSYGIVIVDMQDSFLSKLPQRPRESLIRNHLELLDLCLQGRYPIFTLELSPGSYGETTFSIKDKANTSPLYSCIKKRYNDGFECTELSEHVQGLEHLVITGVNARACVFETTTSAANARFSVHIADDLIADGNKPRWKWDGWRRSEAYHFYRSECHWYAKRTSLFEVLRTSSAQNTSNSPETFI
ncbi:isochorismatase family protein [Candidatus Woesearchaeota archaeon]|nr:isochorismatase family protein [Candidatus Woesearchaeota archaeon]